MEPYRAVGGRCGDVGGPYGAGAHHDGACMGSNGDTMETWSHIGPYRDSMGIWGHIAPYRVI